jgi:uncharacterized protein YecE (DUF72 family)
MNPIQVGACGFSYKDWSGHFYPSKLAATGYLSYYAERFPVVEVDSTFYGSPTPRTVEGWRDKTPDGFGFSLKVPQTITHEKLLKDCEQERDLFVSAARLLGSKLRVCLLQFGYMDKKVFADLDAFLARLDPFLASWPPDVPVAVEIRNQYWVGPALADCLRRHRATWALSDQSYMPLPLDIIQKLDAAAVTGPLGYVRLLGDRVEVDRRTDKLNRIVIERDEQIASDAKALRWLSARVPVLAFVNNHFSGYAPETIDRLLRELQDP